MANRFFTYFTCLIALLCVCTVVSPHAWAQNCSYQRDLIFEMRDGQIGSYNVWDAVYGEIDHVESFSSAVNVGEAETIAVGMRTDDEGQHKEFLMARYDYRGRISWEKKHTIKSLRDVLKILPLRESFLVIANIGENERSGKIWVGLFNDKGDLLRKNIIAHPQNKGLNATDIIAMKVRKGFTVSANVYDKAGATYSALYFLNAKGQVIRNRAYLTGPENKIHGLSQAGDDGYFATGEIESSDGRFAGWAVRLDKEGAMVWQQQYVRGVRSVLLRSAPYKQGFFIVSGYSEPHKTGQPALNRAGWVMALDANSGEIAWQRYYTGMYAYTARDVLISKDGLISVMLDGDWLSPDLKKNPTAYNPATDLGERKDIDYVSLLTIDPRGRLLFNDPHYFAQGSDAKQLFYTHKMQRALVGSTRTLYQIENGDGEEVKGRLSQDAWLLVTPQTEPYADPCVR